MFFSVFDSFFVFVKLHWIQNIKETISRMSDNRWLHSYNSNQQFTGDAFVLNSTKRYSNWRDRLCVTKNSTNTFTTNFVFRHTNAIVNNFKISFLFGSLLVRCNGEMKCIQEFEFLHYKKSVNFTHYKVWNQFVLFFEIRVGLSTTLLLRKKHTAKTDEWNFSK